jgi:hypothetical protein
VQNNKGKDQDFSKLRDLSEEILANDPEKIRTPPPEYTEDLIHELQVSSFYDQSTSPLSFSYIFPFSIMFA